MAATKSLTAREIRDHRGHAIGAAIDLIRSGHVHGDVIQLAARIEQYVLHGKTAEKPE